MAYRALQLDTLNQGWRHGIHNDYIFAHAKLGFSIPCFSTSIAPNEKVAAMHQSKPSSLLRVLVTQLGNVVFVE